MATKIVKRFFCDWCETEMFDPGVTTAYAAKVSHWENGPHVWHDEELCSECDRQFKALRSSRQALKGGE